MVKPTVRSTECFVRDGSIDGAVRSDKRRRANPDREARRVRNRPVSKHVVGRDRSIRWTELLAEAAGRPTSSSAVSNTNTTTSSDPRCCGHADARRGPGQLDGVAGGDDLRAERARNCLIRAISAESYGPGEIWRVKGESDGRGGRELEIVVVVGGRWAWACTGAGRRRALARSLAGGPGRSGGAGSGDPSIGRCRRLSACR